jgi:uncharacterized surface protein with fasciclin (FAS1) repeats
MKFKTDLAALIKQIDELSTLLNAVTAANLVNTIEEKGPFTIFAPDNEAFNKIPSRTFDDLLKNKDRLTAVLTYHVVNGRYLASDLAKQKTVKTAQGQTLDVHEHHRLRHGIEINDAAVLEANLECTNGVIHIIDTVLMPM